MIKVNLSYIIVFYPSVNILIGKTSSHYKLYKVKVNGEIESPFSMEFNIKDYNFKNKIKLRCSVHLNEETTIFNSN